MRTTATLTVQCTALALALAFPLGLAIARAAAQGDPSAREAIAAAQELNNAARAANAAARAANAPAHPGKASARASARASAHASAQSLAIPAAPSPAAAASVPAPPPRACKGTLYLTFDTGSQSQAELIAQVLNRHHIQATFFLSNEKTVRGDYALDPAWSGYWRARVAEGHAFGSRTFDKAYLAGEGAGGRIKVKPQFGAQAGQLLEWSPQQFCDELRRVDLRFRQLTGGQLDPVWRAPGGRVSARTLAAGQACGMAHVGWAKAGFAGDELSSTTYPNALLLRKSLNDLRDGDIFAAHMGIWSRQDPWAPANLEALVSGLEQKGFCFATLRDHPDYSSLYLHR